MNKSKASILSAVRRELEHRYAAFPAHIREQAIENVIPFLERLSSDWYALLTDPLTDNDYSITNVVRDGLQSIVPEMFDDARPV